MTMKMNKEHDLNIKTDNFIKDVDEDYIINQKLEISAKIEVTSTGIRQLSNKKKIDIQNEKETLDPNQ